mgnify:FL=1
MWGEVRHVTPKKRNAAIETTLATSKVIRTTNLSLDHCEKTVLAISTYFVL